MILVTALAVACVAAPNETPDLPSDYPNGFFYGVPAFNGFETLLRYELGQSVQHIGHRGDLFFDGIVPLAWDPARRKLFGIGYLRGGDNGVGYTAFWCSVDPDTGRADLLWSYSQPGLSVTGIAYDPEDGLIYFTPGCPVEDPDCDPHGPHNTTIARFDPGTGQTETVYDDTGGSLSGLTYVSNFLGKYTGLLTVSTGLTVFTGTTFVRENIGGDPSNSSGTLFFDPISHSLYSSNSPTGLIYKFDEVNGVFREVYFNHDPAESFSVFAFVPNVPTIAPECRLADFDDDFDIDLRDFAHFQDCWTGPRDAP